MLWLLLSCAVRPAGSTIPRSFMEPLSGPTSMLHRRHLTCPAENRFCPLCARNPLKRCSPSSNFAAKQFETQLLKARCDAAIKVGFVREHTSTQAAAAVLSSPQAGSAEPETDGVCLEVRAADSPTLHRQSSSNSSRMSASSTTLASGHRWSHMLPSCSTLEQG